MKQSKQLYSQNKIAEILGISRGTFSKWLKENSVSPKQQKGQRKLYDETVIEQYKQSKKTSGSKDSKRLTTAELLQDNLKEKQQEIDYLKEQLEEKDAQITAKKSELEKAIASKKEEISKEEKVRIKKMIPRGVVLLTYIVAENEDGMYLIDQHAAAERINYEKILKQMNEKPVIVDLLVPIKIELRPDEFILVKERFELLEKYGFTTSEFGFNTIIIRSHPAWIPEDRAEDIIKKIVDIIIEKGSFDFDQFIWRMAATTACRMSVMANTYISKEDQEWILENIRYCDNPFTCPHGRPTIITYTRYELERLFKRQLD